MIFRAAIRVNQPEADGPGDDKRHGHHKQNAGVETKAQRIVQRAIAAGAGVGELRCDCYRRENATEDF